MPGTFTGRTDLPLSPEGVVQARALIPLLQSARPGSVSCSPLLRARQTADIMLEGCPLPVRIDDDLREIDFGRWECKTFEQIEAQDPRAVSRWAKFDNNFAFPEGESLGGFLARMRRACRRLCDDPADTVLAVTHGGVIRAMLCRLLGLRARQYVAFDVAPASCTVIDVFDKGGVVSGLNLRSWEGR
jgi:broad specificity phosphatase PhoE